MQNRLIDNDLLARIHVLVQRKVLAWRIMLRNVIKPKGGSTLFLVAPFELIASHPPTPNFKWFQELQILR